jgi:hypothetical protein
MDRSRGPRIIRFAAIAGSALAAAVYVFIATDVITVIEDQQSASPAPLVVAAALFALLAVLLVRTTRRSVLIGGIALQVIVLAGYLMIASERTPAFEAWGIAQKVLQGALLVMLVALLLPNWSVGGRRASHP